MKKDKNKVDQIPACRNIVFLLKYGQTLVSANPRIHSRILLGLHLNRLLPKPYSPFDKLRGNGIAMDIMLFFHLC
jgi:hypothetical protein